MRKFLIGLVSVALDRRGVRVERQRHRRERHDRRDGTGPSATASADPCAPENLNLLTTGTLTVGTDNPAFQPWFAGTGTYGPWKAKPSSGTGNPASGEGFESAVAYAIADKLGFTQDQVTWVPHHVQRVVQARRQGVRLRHQRDLLQAPTRAQAVDFSESYYDVYAGARRRQGHADRAGHDVRRPQGRTSCGAQIGTTSYSYIVNNIQPDQQPAVFDRSVDVIARPQQRPDRRLRHRRSRRAYVNVLIGQVKNGVVVGQFPAIGDAGVLRARRSPRGTRSSAA